MRRRKRKYRLTRIAEVVRQRKTEPGTVAEESKMDRKPKRQEKPD